RTDSGGAGLRRGGQGYEKHYRALVDCRTIVTADRVRLGCYGLNGGKAGQPFCVTVDAEGEGYDLGGLVDGEPVLKGQVVRVVTTGGGGWGDPLQRELDLVLRDVIEGRVSLMAAKADYGVAFKDAGSAGQPVIDEAATRLFAACCPSAARAARPRSMTCRWSGPAAAMASSRPMPPSSRATPRRAQWTSRVS